MNYNNYNYYTRIAHPHIGTIKPNIYNYIY